MSGAAKTVKGAFKSITPSFLGGDAKGLFGHRAWADVKRTGRNLDDSGITAAAAGYVIGGPAGAVTAYGMKKQRDAMGNLVSDMQPVDAPVMPTTDDEAVQQARKRAIAEQLRRSGRQSTILTDGDQLGG
jgi:hypothetical protein